MPKDFLQGASLTPTFIQHFKCGELHIFHIRFNIVKKHPLQNRTNVKIKGGGWKAFWTMLKKTALFLHDGFPKSMLISDHHTNWQFFAEYIQHLNFCRLYSTVPCMVSHRQECYTKNHPEISGSVWLNNLRQNIDYEFIFVVNVSAYLSYQIWLKTYTSN